VGHQPILVLDQQVPNSESTHSFNPTGPAIDPCKLARGVLVAQPILAAFFVDNHHVPSSISVQIPAAEKLIRTFIDNRGDFVAALA
jgi:hypothetical protein